MSSLTASQSSTSHRWYSIASIFRSRSDLAGRVPAAAFEPDALAQRPPRLAEPGSRNGSAEPVAAIAALSADEEETVLLRLRMLGYVE